MFLKPLARIALIAAFPAALLADLSVQVNVDPSSGHLPISPYVYGTDQDLPGVATPGARRYGGNRLTGYNWETNASNAGTDYLNESDNYLVSGLPNAEQGVPAIALTSFHDQSLAMGTPYTILTLQMAGYVSADESGPVTAAQTAPSSRWNVVKNDTPGGVFPATPNLGDGTVYMDELLNLLVTRYGPGNGKTGVKGYNLDNEPALWVSTHPYLHPVQPTCAELLTKSVALAKTVKRMDSTAEVLGAVLYGSESYFTFQNAPDWPSIQSSTGFRWFIDYYLDQMGKASATAGTRLLDVLDLHRYSDENVSGTGPDQSITNQTDFSDKASDMDRVQAPRVLWDPTYKENSWVQQYFPQFLPWIPNIQASITARYPGTKLSFSEYNYGGESDISGGIAQADVLGIYGKFDVYLGCVWILHSSPQPLYTAAAFNLYLDYDGKGGKFGDTAVSETDSDTVNSSAYASVDASGSVHVVALNKSFTQATSFTFHLAGSTSYASAAVYAFDSSAPSITQRASATVTGNTLTYSVPALTAAHFIFTPNTAAPTPTPTPTPVPTPTPTPTLPPSSHGPPFTLEPSSQTIASGTTVVFEAAAAASSYQWYLNGAPLLDGGAVSGASGPQLVITGATAAAAGSYTCIVTNGSGTTTSSAAVLSVSATTDTGRLINLSCRADVGTGANFLIAGFVISGGGSGASESLLVRGSGPALAGFGVSGTLADPQLRLLKSNNDGTSSVLATNDGWGGDAQVASASAAVNAFAFPSATSHDTALLRNLGNGAYTAQISGESNDSGVALAEVYDATPPGSFTSTSAHLVNISARAGVGTGSNILIAGFVVGGSTAQTVLVRASGPALVAFGVGGTLPDPGLKLYRSNNDGTATLLDTNVGWGANPQIAAAASKVGAFSWGTAETLDSALLVTLPPGAYTAQVAGAGNDTGVALVEVYDVP
jgi:Glycoside hydrolase family 44/Immunoglobulin I-set domain